MAGIRFPNTLPPPDGELGDAYTEIRSKFQPEIGQSRNRNKYIKAPRIFNVKWTLDQNEYGSLRDFYYNAIRQGERQFDVQLIDGTDILTWFTVNWVDGFKATYENGGRNGPIWTVTAKLRAASASFIERPPTADDLYGITQMTYRNTGQLVVGVGLYGVSDVVVENEGTFLQGPLYGITSAEATNTAWLKNQYLYGVAEVEFDNVGELDYEVRATVDGDRRVTRDGNTRVPR